MAGKFVYRGDSRTPEDVARAAKQSGSTYDSYINPELPLYKPREGECQIRILPATWEDEERWGRGWSIGVQVHYGIGADEATYLCLDKMKGEPCPICEAKRKISDPDEADALRVSWRALCWVIDRDNEKAGPQVWSMPITVYRDINARSQDKRTGAIVKIDHPAKGYDILFNREGSNKRTKYTQIEIDRSPTYIHDDEKKQDQWLAYIADHSLDKELNFYEYDYIKSVLFGKIDRRNKDEDEEQEAPRRGRRSAEPEEEEQQSSRRGRREAPAEEEERPSSRRRGAAEDPPFEPDPPRRRAAEPEEEAPRRRSAAAEEEAPTRRRPPAEDAEHEAAGSDEPAPRRRAAAEPAEEEAPARRRSGSEDGGDAPPPRRRAAAEPEAEEAPPRRRAAAPEQDEEAPAPRRRAAAEPEEDDAPRRRRAAAEEPADETDDPTGTARRQLGRLKDRAS